MPIAYFRKEFMFVQPDGREIRLYGWGNQFNPLFEDPKGYTVIKDSGTGFYQYARLTADRTGFESTGKNVGVDDPDTLGLEKHLRKAEKKSEKMKALKGAAKPEVKSRWQERREAARAAALKTAKKKGGPLTAPPAGETKGKFVGLCLLIGFPEDGDAQNAVPKTAVEAFCNKPGYSDYGNNGSVSDYFREVSGGRIDYTNIVTDYYIAKNSKEYYSDPAVEQPIRTYELIGEALENLKSGGFDASQLSSDSKDYVYALNVFYAGRCINEWAKGLWPHSWHLEEPFDIGNGKKVFDYQISDMGDELSIATFCHENGHMICDFPDLYDYGYESCGVGSFCLMCSGGPDGKNPTQVCAYLKYKAGWGDTITTLDKGEFTVRAGKNDFLLYPKNGTEYFIIENRFRQGRDVALPGSGLAIWHVDETGDNENEQMTPARHYECSLEQADGRFDLERLRNDGDPGDLFVSPATFGNATSPDSLWWDGTPSGLEITGISKAGEEMHLTVDRIGAERKTPSKKSRR
jgi:M6 family metalloprotease-like protein